MSRNWRAKQKRAGSLGQASRMYPIRRPDCVPDGVCARIPGAQGFGRHNPSIGGMLSLGIMKQNRKAGGNNVCVFTDEFGVKHTPCDGGGGGGGFGCPCVQLIYVLQTTGANGPVLGSFSATGGITGEVISLVNDPTVATRWLLLVTLDNCESPLQQSGILSGGQIPQDWTGTVLGVPPPSLSLSPPCPCLQIFQVLNQGAGAAIVDNDTVSLPPPSVVVFGTVIRQQNITTLPTEHTYGVLMMLPPEVPCDENAGVPSPGTIAIGEAGFPDSWLVQGNAAPVQLQGSGGGGDNEGNGNAACCSCQGPKAYCPNCWERKTRFTLSTK